MVTFRLLRRQALDETRDQPRPDVLARTSLFRDVGAWLWVAGAALVARRLVRRVRRRPAVRKADDRRREWRHVSRVAMAAEMSDALAHSLNQPLTVIRCNAQVAQRMLAEPQRLKEVDLALEDIEEATRRASDVLERLRLFLRRNDAPFERLDLNGVTGEVVSLARRELAPRGVSIAFRPAARLPQVNGGRMQLQQAIWHLVLNAAEAISGNDPGDRHITVATGAADGSLQVAVSDRGAGIPPELLHRVFEPFFTSKPQGIGLGLSICRSIVIAHGGEVWAANNPDRGATVCFTVPPATDAPVRAREHGSGTTG